MRERDVTGALEARVARLERRERAWLVAGLLVAAGAALGSGRAPDDAEALRVPALELVDAEGRVRAALRLESGAPELRMLDLEGVARLTLKHDAEETALFIRDASGTVRIGAAQFAHGGGGFALHGEDAKGAAALYLARGRGSLSFYDVDGGVRLRLPEAEP